MSNKNIQNLRKRFAKTQTEMSEIMNISQAAYSKIEKGLITLSDLHKQLLQNYFSLPETYFDKTLKSSFLISLHEGNFSKRASVPKNQLSLFEVECGYMQLVLNALISNFDFETGLKWIPIDIGSSTLESHEIEHIALECRRLWQIPNEPISREGMMSLLESLGIFVLCLDCKDHKVFGYSFETIDSKNKVIIYNRVLTGEDLQFTLAHELGHLLLHGIDSNRLLSEKEKEREANAFASSFLMPNYIFTQDLGRLKLNELLYFKKRWEVPARSIIYRAKELGILSEKQATYFYIETSRLGWARQEPDSLPRVKPKLFEDLLKLLSEDFEDELAFSNYLGIPYKWVNSWLDKGKVAYLKLVV